MIKGSKQKSVESVKSVRNKKAHTDSTDDTDGTPSFKFVRFGAICVISREATPFNPMNLLNHPKGVCLYINKFLRND